MLAYEGAAVYRHDVIVGHGCAQSHLSHEVFHGLPVHREYHCAVHYEENLRKWQAGGARRRSRG